MDPRPDRGPGRLRRTPGSVEADSQPVVGGGGQAAQRIEVGELERADDGDGRLAGLTCQVVGPHQAWFGCTQQALHQHGPTDLEQCHGCIVGPQERGQLVGRRARRRVGGDEGRRVVREV